MHMGQNEELPLSLSPQGGKVAARADSDQAGAGQNTKYKSALQLGHPMACAQSTERRVLRKVVLPAESNPFDIKFGTQLSAWQ